MLAGLGRSSVTEHEWRRWRPPVAVWLERCAERSIRRHRSAFLNSAPNGDSDTNRTRLKHPESELVSIELDAKLLEVAKRTAPGTTFIHGSVGDLPKLLDEHGWDQFDVCISCLPVPSLPKRVNQTVIEAWEQRCTNSVFSQLTAIPWVYWGMYRKMFHHVSFNLVWINTPQLASTTAEHWPTLTSRVGWLGNVRRPCGGQYWWPLCRL